MPTVIRLRKERRQIEKAVLQSAYRSAAADELQEDYQEQGTLVAMATPRSEEIA